MAKRKRTNNNLQHTTQNIKDWATRAPLKTGVNSGRKGVKFSNNVNSEFLCNELKYKSNTNVDLTMEKNPTQIQKGGLIDNTTFFCLVWLLYKVKLETLISRKKKLC